MSDYTPTTEEVRDAYCESYADNFYDFKREDFDRWLDEVKAQAWEEGWTHNIGDSSWNSLYDNPYRQGEGSGNSNSQPTAETSIYLDRHGEER